MKWIIMSIWLSGIKILSSEELYDLNYDKWFIDVQLDNLLFELFLIMDPITYKCIVHNMYKKYHW